MLGRILTAALQGLDAHLVHAEVDVSPGLPGITIVGLPDTSVQEAKERVRTALRNTGFEVPPRRITVNLAPADLRKEGPAFDLPIAIALLLASGRIAPETGEGILITGELGLDGTVRAVPGVLSMALAARARDVRRILVPRENAAEAASVPDIGVYAITSLSEAVRFLTGATVVAPATPVAPPATAASAEPDFVDIKGHTHAKRALEVAAAGGHNILMTGPPGTGKTLLARALRSILPPLDASEALEVTRVYSIAGLLPPASGLLAQRPFRAPHHTSSHAAILGGGGTPRPGEVSFAHGGVLFLDEMGEFHRDVLEALRGPIEDGRVSVTRAGVTLSFPARFLLAGAMNPCPCGYFGDRHRACTCLPGQVRRYAAKASGPILDRIDLHVQVPRLPGRVVVDEPGGEPSAAVCARVVAARERQRARCGDAGVDCNARIPARALPRLCAVAGPNHALLRAAADRLHLSPRGVDRILRVARTIADLAASDAVGAEHLAEAIQYRSLDARAGAST